MAPPPSHPNPRHLHAHNSGLFELNPQDPALLILQLTRRQRQNNFALLTTAARTVHDQLRGRKLSSLELNLAKWLKKTEDRIEEIKITPYFKRAGLTRIETKARLGEGILVDLATVAGLLCMVKCNANVPCLDPELLELKNQAVYHEFLSLVDSEAAKIWAGEFVACFEFASPNGWKSSHGASRKPFASLLRKVAVGSGGFPMCLAAETSEGSYYGTLLTPQIQSAFKDDDKGCPVKKVLNDGTRGDATDRLWKVLAELKSGTTTTSN